MPLISFVCDSSEALNACYLDTDKYIVYVQYRSQDIIYQAKLTEIMTRDLEEALRTTDSKGKLFADLKNANIIALVATDISKDKLDSVIDQQMIGDVLDGDGEGESDGTGDSDDSGEEDEGGEEDGGGGEEVDFDTDMEKQVEDKEYACSYCGLADKQSVVKSVDANNGKGRWFCNGRGHSSASHIVQHLVRSKNKVVQLHPDSAMGDIVLECYNCGKQNVFLLGFIPAKSDSVVVLLCRDPCLTNGSLKGMDWDLSTWQAVINDKTFLPWLVRVPTEKEQLRARQITAQQINKLEELWRDQPDSTVFDIDKPGADEEIKPLLDKYEDGYHYQNIMGPLVQMEAEHDRKMKENHRMEDVSVRWDNSFGKRIAVLQAYGFKDDSDMRLVIGDEICLKLDERITKSYKRAPFNAIGHIMWINDGEVALEMTTHDIPTMITDGYTAEFVWKGISFERMQFALKTFAIDNTSLSGYLYHRLLGHDVQPQTLKTILPSKMSVDGLPELNQSQINALKNVLSSPLSLIQGPPGTGKTVTSASLVYHLAKQNVGQVLVCAPSNIAVDQLTEKIAMTGLKVVRVAAKSRESTLSSIEHLTLHCMVKNLDTPDKAELRKYQKLKDELGDLNAADAKRYQILKRKAEIEILKAADVICTTCVGAGDKRLANFRFRQLLIDEATQAMEAECLIPIVMGVKQLVLVGDHCQLGPVVTCKKAGKAGLTQSLFERLVLMRMKDTKPIRLEMQYRMHPCLSEFPSNMFYEGKLQNGLNEFERTMPDQELPFIFENKPMMFIVNNGLEEMASSGK